MGQQQHTVEDITIDKDGGMYIILLDEDGAPSDIKLSAEEVHKLREVLK